jgi:hypothetical protein
VDRGGRGEGGDGEAEGSPCLEVGLACGDEAGGALPAGGGTSAIPICC